MKKLLLCVFILSVSIVSAQKTIKINIQENNTTKSIQNEKITSTDKFNIKESIYSIDVVSQNSKQGEYVQLQADGLQKTFNAGNPELPVYAKLIEIPLGSKVELNVLSFDEKEIQLGEFGVNTKIIPAQESVSKSSDPDKIPFKLNKEIYSNNSFFKNEFVQFEDFGYLRDKHLGYIQISPFEYNPISNTLKIRYNFDIEVKFVSDNKSVTINKKNLQSPYFENLPLQTINSLSDSKELISAPVKYVIVSPRTFEATLQPFIEWKKLVGYNVVEAYTDVIGTTTSSIKAYLENMYENPSDGVSPTFVLLVGDVAQIPAYNNQVAGDSHVTDLYYFEYTGDYLPEVFYGRFSATTTAQLQSQIDKTLQVEKYLMPNKDYLNNVVLIAGADASMAPTYGNGFVNYATTYYINSTNGYNAIPYLYPASASADAQIRTDISNGVALANYTAHCSNDGWSDPSFSISNIASMTNQDMYPLMIGNCCQSVKFEGSSFGEEILRVENKGAVGYIGASDFSYWDEDYYWAIGNRTSITANPTYDATKLGAYDKFFHTHSEARTDWFITQGQMNVAGNLAVQASTSGRKPYYWEIYHLMGDPSLTPFVKVPTALTASYNPEIIVGSNTFTVNTEEDAFVALSLNGVLLDVELAGVGGVVNLSFNAITEVGTADLVITKQNRVPVITQISILPSSSPYVVKDNVIINDASGNNNGTLENGETVKLNVQLKNVSQTYDAFLVNAKLTSSDSNIVIVDSLETYGTIVKNTVALMNDAFEIEIGNDILDQTQVELNLKVTGEDVDNNPYTWNSKVNFTLNAPKIEIGEMIVDDSSGDNDGILDPGETAILKLVVENNGHALISGLSASVSLLSDGNSYVTINTSTVNGISLDVMDADTLNFNVTAELSAENGQIVYFAFHVNDLTYDFYSIQGDKELTIGPISDILISQQGTVQTSNVYFYDSGGNTNNYLNNENYSITFTPANAGEIIQAEFLSFDVESHSTCDYDYIKVYDGLTTSSTLIGTYCGTNSPGSILASNANGALTFAFKSDGSEYKSGWKAKIKSTVLYNYNLTVYNENGPIEGATVEFYGQTIVTGADGVANFENIPEGIDRPLLITANGFVDYSTTIDMFSNITDDVTLIKELYQIKFIIFDKSNNNRIQNAEIQFLNQTVYSNEDGEYDFNNLEFSLNEEYSITKENYVIISGFVDINSSKNLNIALEVPSYNITFVVVDTEEHPIIEAKIDFNTTTSYTNSSGVAIFTKVIPKTDMVYVVSKSGYTSITDTIDVNNEDKTINLSLSVITAVDDIPFENLMIYPNPSQGLINIDFGSNKNENMNINVYDVLGRSIFNKSLIANDNNKETINLSNQPKGIYFVTIQKDSGEKISKKIILK